MNFEELIKVRQSCRKYDVTRAVEDEKLSKILEAARLAPSACNGQPYKITVCKGDTAKEVAVATTGMGMNRFALDVPVLLVISEDSYVPTAERASKAMNNDYRSMDIGIVAAYITFAAAEVGLGSCMLGWFDEARIYSLIGSQGKVRLVITVGYPAPDDPIREKKRKPLEELIKTV